MIKKHIPNTITCLNAFSGCMAILQAVQGEYKMAAFFVALAAVFDFFDGFAARLLHVASPIGKELDSLADTISFGLAPAFVLYNFMSEDMGLVWQPYAAFLIAVLSIVRLAKFNLDARQTTSFIGLATPANAIFWIFLIGWYGNVAAAVSPWLILAVILSFSLLLVSELPMFSLKIKTLNFSENWVRFLFLAGCAVLVLVLGLGGMAFAIVWYIILSVIVWAMGRSRQ